VCGLHRCFIQPLTATPRPFMDAERAQTEIFGDEWQEMPTLLPFINPYREGWELFLRHVAEDGAFPSPLIEGAKGVQLAEACHQSHRERRWITLDKLNL
jgi:predicted dehydrogenase